MITIQIAVAIVVLVLLLVCSALISGSEVAFFSISPKEKKEIQNAIDSKKNEAMRSLLEQPERLLATVLIANNFVNIGIVVLSKYISDNVFSFGHSVVLRLLIEVVVITFLILLFGEIIPKVYANKKPLRFASFMAPTINGMEKFFHPLASVLIYSTNLITRKVKKEGAISLDELSQAIEIASEDIDEERDMLEGIVRFSNISASEVMRPRTDVVSVEINTTFTKLKAIIVDSGFSRIPVYVKTFDDIRGVLYVKDLLPHLDKPSTFRWQTLIRQPFFIPESKKINDLLQDFQTKKMHMAIVIDEYGGSSGIVTMEDVLEEIVGEISDENDEEEKWCKEEAPNRYVFEGKTPVAVFEEILGLEENSLLEGKIEVDTLAGLLLEIKGGFPEKNEEIAYKDFIFVPTVVDERRIKQIKVVYEQKK